MPADHVVDDVGEINLRIKTVELGRLQHGMAVRWPPEFRPEG